MTSTEALIDLVKNYEINQNEVARLLKTTRSQISMAVIGHRDLSAPSQILLSQLRDSLEKVKVTADTAIVQTVPLEGKETFREFWQIKMLDLKCSQWKRDKSLKTVKDTFETAKNEVEACGKLLECLPIDGENYPHFERKLHHRRCVMKVNGPYPQLELQIKKDLLIAQADVITKYLAMLD